MRQVIDLNYLLPEGVRFAPLFENESNYNEFRERYEAEVGPVLEEQASKRRKSEEEARRRPIGLMIPTLGKQIL